MKAEIARVVWEYQDWVHECNQELNEQSKERPDHEIPDYERVSFQGFIDWLTNYL